MEADVSVWDIVQYSYCPRKLYFYKTLKIPVVTRKKMEYGSEEHTREHKREHKRVKERNLVYGFSAHEVENVYHDLYIEDVEIGLYGQVDTVVELKNGDLCPVEVKYSDSDVIFENWRKQILAYGLLLEKRFGSVVKRGVFYFPKLKRGVIVELSMEDKKSVLYTVEKIRLLVKSEKIPRGRERCGYCEVVKLCKA